MIDYIAAIAFADITVEFYGYFLRWAGWQAMLAVVCVCWLVYQAGRFFSH